MRLELSSVRPISVPEPRIAGWDDLRGIQGGPTPNIPGPLQPDTEKVLSQDTLRTTLIELGTAPTPSNIALAEAFAKLGVPLTEANLLEGQTVLARTPSIKPAVYALSKALSLPPTLAILNAIASATNHLSAGDQLDSDTLAALSLLPRASESSAALSDYLDKVIRTLGQSTENKIASSNALEDSSPLYDVRSTLLQVANTQFGGTQASAAYRHASFIEGQQVLNQAAIQKFDTLPPLHFSFSVELPSGIATCEIQVKTSAEKSIRDSQTQDDDKYLQAVVRVQSLRLGTVEVSLIGMWSGRLVCTAYAAKQATCRLIKRENKVLRDALARLGWSVSHVDVVRREQFCPLWLGGDTLNQPRLRVDQRI